MSAWLVKRLKARCCFNSSHVRVPSSGELLYVDGNGSTRVLGVSHLSFAQLARHDETERVVDVWSYFRRWRSKSRGRV